MDESQHSLFIGYVLCQILHLTIIPTVSWYSVLGAFIGYFGAMYFFYAYERIKERRGKKC